MKIAYVSPEWPDAANGIVAYVRHITLALHQLGHSVIVLTPKVNAVLGFETALPLHVNRPSSVAQRLFRKVKRAVGVKMDPTLDGALAIVDALRDLKARGGVDILEMEETFGTAAHVAERADIPVVVREHGPHFLNALYDKGGAATLDDGRLLRERRALERAAALTVPSAQVLEITREYYRLKRPASVIPNPVPLVADDDAPHWSLRSSSRDELLFVGRTDSRKGGDTVLRVFDRLAVARPGLRLHFVGPDTGFVDASSSIACRDYAATHLSPGVAERVIFHGPLREPEIAALRRRARITLVCSRFEVFPYVCTEALALGCPLVATAVGGIPEIVRHADNGLLAGPDDVDALAGHVASLLDSDELCVLFGNRGREWCREALNPTKIATETLEVYSALLHR